MTLASRITTEKRVGLLKKLLAERGFIRAIEVHSGLSAIIGNSAEIEAEGKKKRSFDALWISSFTETASKGHPDAEILGFDSRLGTINEVAEVSDKPIIVDGDTGGDPSHFEYMVKKMERAGVSAVIIEDKVFPKRNSLDPTARQELENPKVFANKIKRGASVRLSGSFMIIARLESLIAGAGMDDALRRAREYLLAGADGIMIHSKSQSPDEVLKFAAVYKKLCRELKLERPLVAVPTTYNTITEDELKNAGFSVVIYANHMLRASSRSMENACRLILTSGRSLETDPHCSPVEDIFRLVGFDEIKKKDKEDEKLMKSEMRVIIPAAGEHPGLKAVLGEKPCCMLEIKGRSVLERQIHVLSGFGLDKVIVIRGYQKGKVNVPGVKYYDNDDYRKKSILYSLMLAENDMKQGFIYLNSDILFEAEIVKRLLESSGDIVIVVDGSYRHHSHGIEKKLDLVKLKYRDSSPRRMKHIENQALRIGKDMVKEQADAEFVGIAKFSVRGAESLVKVYADLLRSHRGRFHEAGSLEKAGITDMLQELIDRGFKVTAIEVFRGWMEIHNISDYERAKREV